MSELQSNKALHAMHRLLLETLRQREQEIFRYLAILAPALGGFVWLMRQGVGRDAASFFLSSVAVLLVLLLGAFYALSLGYNYRYIILELAKLEAMLGIREAMLNGWPRTPKDFLDRYRWIGIPWCTPPEIIKGFWIAFLIGIVAVTIIASVDLAGRDEGVILALLGIIIFLLSSFYLPIRFGFKFRKLCKREPLSWPEPESR